MKRPTPESNKKESKAEVVKIQYDSTNEVVVIASVVADEKIRKKYLHLPNDLFFGPGHAEMWVALQELYHKGLAYDIDTMRTIAGGKFDVDVLDEYVREHPVAPANIKHHINNLKWDKRRHEASRGILPLLIEQLKDIKGDSDRIKSLSRQLYETFTGSGDMQYMRDARSIVIENDREMTERRLGRAVYPFGFDGLDVYTEGERKGQARMIPGLAPKMITALTGLSGSGKTSFTANLVQRQVKMGKKILWGAWEQTPHKSLELVATIDLEMSRSEVMSGKYDEDDQKIHLAKQLEYDEVVKFFDLPFGKVIRERDKHPNDANLDLIHQYVAESGCDIFIADVFKMALVNRKPDDEAMAIERIKAIAAACNCHIILVHHLNLKDVESRQDKKPTRDAVMGSSGWINNVDNNLAIHCPGLFNMMLTKTMEVHILKQRFGAWPQAVEFDWDPEFCWIKDGGRTIDVNRATSEETVTDFLSEEPKPERPRSWRKKNH